MMGWILGGMIAFSVIAGFFSGNMESVSNAAIGGGQEALRLTLSLTGMLMLWSGVMKVAERSGLAAALSKLLSPLTRRLFPRLSPGGAALEKISLNLSANLLGLGNAATPLGLSAMQELDRLNPEKGTATDEMLLFVVLNTASLQLLPATNAALRLAAGSRAPMEILPAVWLSSVLSVTAGLAVAKLGFRRRGERKHRPDSRRGAAPCQGACGNFRGGDARSRP